MSVQKPISDAYESNAGDDFHVLWAARKALQLILPGADLKAVGIEGPSQKEAVEVDPNGGNLLSIDTAEYYGSNNFLKCSTVVFSQLKYSTRRSKVPWTAARLCQGKKSGGKGSIIERLAETFLAYVKKYKIDNVRDLLVLKLVSNRPVSKKLSRALKEAQGKIDSKKPVLWVKLKKSLSKETKEELERLYKASKLNSGAFTIFLSMLNLNDCGSGSRFEHKSALIEELAKYDDPRIKEQYRELKGLVNIRMLPEGRNIGPIIAEDLPPIFGRESLDSFFPAKSSFGKLENIVERKQLQNICNAIIQNQGKVTCLHADGGSGKTTLCQMLQEFLPTCSETIIFDCYGSGSYKSPAKIRHVHRRAIVQIANELAVKTGSYLLLGFDLPKEEYLERLCGRLKTAQELIKSGNPEALLVIIIDAADNSFAAEKTLGGDNFVSDIVNKGFVTSLPDNCRIVVTTRSHRVPDLALPNNTEHIKIENFDVEESELYLKKYFPEANDNQVKDFHDFSSRIPRRQFYALDKSSEGFNAVLDALTPQGVNIDGLIDKLLDEAGNKLGIEKELKSICRALVELPSPVPIKHIASVASVSPSAVRDFYEDMFPGLRLENDALSFTDEDFETRLHEIYGKFSSEWLLEVTEYLLKQSTSDTYAAENIGSLLFQLEKNDELFDIILNKSSLEFIVDPILKKNIFINRTKLALKAAIKNDNKETLLKLLLVAARAAKTDKAVRKLITEHADLTSKYGDYRTVQRLYLEEQETHWYGPSHLHCSATLSRNKNTRLLAKDHLINAGAWLRWRHQRNDEELKDYPIRDDDIAAETEAIFNLFGFDKAYPALDRWSPKEAVFRVSKLVFERLINNQKAIDLCDVIRKNPLRPDIELILMESLFTHGLDVPKGFIDRNYKVWLKFASCSKSVNDSLRSAGVLFCELLVEQDYKPSDVLPLINLFSPAVLEYVSLYNRQDQMDALMRAQTLKAFLLGNELKAEELFPRELTEEKELTNEEKYERNQKIEEFKRIYTPLLSVYRCRIQAMTGKYEGKPDKIIQSAVENSNIEYQVRGTEQMVLKNLASYVLVDTALLISKNPEQWIDTVQGKYLEKDMALPTRLQIAKKLSQHKKMHEKALRILDEVIKIIEDSPMVASEQVDTYIQCSTITDRINSEVAKEYYKKAIEAAEEIDQEAFAEIICLYNLSEQASADCPDLSEPELAYYLASYTETCSRRMYGYDHFPWTEGIKATTYLDSASGFAMLSRWNDRGVNYIDDEILPILDISVQKDYISPHLACALLVMADYNDGRTSKTRTSLLSAEQTKNCPLQNMLSVISKDILLHDELNDRKYNAEKIIDWLKENSPKDISNIQELVSMHDFVDSLNEKGTEEPEYPTQEKTKKEKSKVNWKKLLDKKDFSDPKNIESAVSFLDKKQKCGYELIHEFFERIKDTCKQDKYIGQLNALVSVDLDIVPFYPLVESIKKRLEAWGYHVSVKKWKKGGLRKFVKAYFHALPSYDHFSAYALNSLADAFGIQNDDKRIEIITPILPDYVDSIPAEAFYNITQSYLKLVPKGASLNILRWYLPELKKDIRFDLGDGDWTEDIAPPQSSNETIPNFLWACLGNPDKRTRWRAVHAVRRAVSLGETQIFDELISASKSPNIEAFKDKKHIFYKYSARLWLFILLERLSKEFHEFVLPHAKFIYRTAVHEGSYHIFIRYFAKSAALSLSKYKDGIYSDEQIAVLKKVSTSPFEQVEKSKEYGRAGKGNEERRFSFGYDTTNYWFSNLENIFGVTRKELFEKAEALICDEWGFEGKMLEQDPLDQRDGGRYAYELTNNRHGGEPTIENLQLYLEYHAMFFVADEFLSTKPLIKDDWDEDPWADWIQHWNLVWDNFWLSDLRDTTPLEAEFWTMPRTREKSWPYEITSDYLDQCASIERSPMEGYILANGHIYRALNKSTESVFISSALVEPEKAPALLRALQTTTNSHNYKIPDEGERLEIDQFGFQLKGWIKNVSADWGGIDEMDPLQSKLKKSKHHFSQEFMDLAGAETSEDGRDTFLKNDHNIKIAKFENWNDFKYKEYKHGMKTEGNRLFVSIEYLLKFLLEKDRCLILECQIRRSDETDDSGYYPGYAKLYIIYPDGRCQSLRSDYQLGAKNS
ncbi:MAG: ATP-binding protein [Candidatus Scalindua sp. AMX11]|nr:MAG: ATP-binding protein [Candidatus Scalindua sp.]NOG82292.1 ATP-binding protein [Planctomycetota bacterium]RZV65906.1 MAG: ATP-binding protein [Candidatus Scalindua sp. SCAELEC01]TDE63564.1 MAG: ATP-binding protein [Candidatus Scalindua sp. AMX11]GJQ60014.1 MAG: hypothetical protein SCALA701_28150 [Candidatus Scalindua sp.]